MENPINISCSPNSQELEVDKLCQGNETETATLTYHDMLSKANEECKTTLDILVITVSSGEVECPSNSTCETLDLVKDASNYVDSMMANQSATAVLRTSLTNKRHKRTLSAPSVGESVNKKLKNTPPSSTDKLNSDSENEKDSPENKAEKRTRLAARRKLQTSSQTENNSKTNSKGNTTNASKAPKIPKTLKTLKGRQNTSKMENTTDMKSRCSNRQFNGKGQSKNENKMDNGKKVEIDKNMDCKTDTNVILEAVTDMR